MICIFGIVMAVFACIWNAIGIDLCWLFLVMGLLIGGAVFPAAFAVTWKGQTKAGAISGAICGLIAGLTAWLVECKVYYGELTVSTTGASYPTLAGNMAGVLTGLLVSVVVSVLKPDNFDWEITRAINAPAAGENPIIVQTGGEDPNHNHNLRTVQDEEKEMIEDEAVIEDPKRLKNAFILAVTASTVLSFIMDFLIPILMFLSHYVFSKGFFIGWVVISFIWVFGAVALCGILPIWETRRFFKELFIEIFAGSKAKPKAETTETQSE
jgi:Na+(H+)/acetate symporter ActP